ncbi:MAG: DUF4390 domain-containing protein [Desulfosalsimonadaceae bacterium]|nr:DUF4390 domain-containing protein [Desulfosalsimonadaceae bacterium]
MKMPPLARQTIARMTAVILCVMMMVPSFAHSEDAILTDFGVSDNGKVLLLNLRVVGAFNKKLQEAILNGIPATFSFFITLDLKRSLLPDSTTADLTATHTLKYHVLKNHFIVKRSWEGNKPLTTDSFEEAQALMSEIKGMKLAPLKKLTPGKHYEIRAKAELDKVNLPPFFNYIFFFTFLWDFETGWHSYEFIHTPSTR